MNKVKQIEFDPPYFDEEEREIMEALKQTLVSSWAKADPAVQLWLPRTVYVPSTITSFECVIKRV